MNPDLQERLLGLLSRKFLASLVAMFLVTFALHVEDEKKLAFIGGILVAFQAANTSQKIWAPNKAETKTTTTTTPETTTTTRETKVPVAEPSPVG